MITLSFESLSNERKGTYRAAVMDEIRDHFLDLFRVYRPELYRDEEERRKKLRSFNHNPSATTVKELLLGDDYHTLDTSNATASLPVRFSFPPYLPLP